MEVTRRTEPAKPEMAAKTPEELEAITSLLLDCDMSAFCGCVACRTKVAA